MKAIVLSLILSLTLPVSGQLIISEIAPTNTDQFADGDGDFPDWIEIYNSGNAAVDLQGYGLSDDDKPKWTFPAFTLDPAQRLLVFASGKNRGGLGGPAVDHWETAINEGNTWHTFIGDTEPPADWTSVDFDENTWTAAQGPFGYGDGDDVTEVPEGTISFYYRTSFDVADASLLDSAILSMDYDDGFIAYLNGTEIARSFNMPPGPADYTTVPTIDHEALLYSGGVPDAYSISASKLASLLQTGRNVLAIQLHNIEPASSDLSARTWLHFGIHTAEVIYGPNPSFFQTIGPGSGYFHTNFKVGFGEAVSLFDGIGVELEHKDVPYLQPGHSLMRIDDTGDWCITTTSTPDATNGNTCFSGYAGSPTIFPQAGFYTGPLEVTIEGTGTRYTTDGSDPDETSPEYTGPFFVDANTVVKARVFDAGVLPGLVAASTYLINEPTYLPVLSISTAHRDLFDDGTGGLAVYDDYESGRRAAVHLEYFSKEQELIFSEKASLRPVGGYSIAFDQKSMQFAFDEEYGATDEVHFPLFDKDKPGITSYREFRVRNMDDDWSTTRMRDVVANRLALPTHCAATGYQHMAVFINGEYWGHYGGREVTNEYYVRDNHGADEDQVDQILTSYFEDEDYLVDEGSGDDFFDMSDFIIQNDMSDPQLFTMAQKRIDWENWVDYYAAEMYLANGDWFSSIYFNNTRLYRAPGVPWRFILFDVTYAQNQGVNSSTNILEEALANPAFPNRYTDMMNSLLQNAGFKNYFINRFADLMNAYFTTEKAIDIIDENIIEIAEEIPRQSVRWGSAGALDWTNSVSYLKDFHEERPAYQRQQIQDYFGLNGQVEVTLQVAPAGAGVIKISTLIPEEYPWDGIYFDGNPVAITAIPNPGYAFDHWTTDLPVNDQVSSFTINIPYNTTLTAHFIGSSQANGLEISEINYHSDFSAEAGDWFEVRNMAAYPLDISDYRFQDRDWFHDFIAPTGTVLQPGQHLVITEDDGLFSAIYPDVVNKVGSTGFGLDNEGEPIHIYDRQDNTVIDIIYGKEAPWPCTPDGYGRTLERYPGINNPDQPESWFDGCIGGSPGEAFSLCVDDVIVSEINYNSSDDLDAGDWFEVKNQLDIPVDLSDWSLRDDDDQHVYVVPEGIVLPPGGYYVFCESIDDLSSQFPVVTNVVGDLDFGLGNGGDVVRLYDASGVIRMSVCYSDDDPWAGGADGDGYTLELSDPHVNLNDPLNWFAGCLGGSPGKAYDPLCVSGVEPVNASIGISLYPNPVTDLLSVTLVEQQTGTATMVDVGGRIISQKEITNGHVTFETKTLGAGIYFVIVKGKEGVFAEKVVKE